jgi:hypothetical protein
VSRFLCRSIMAGVLVALGPAPLVPAGEMKAELDCGANAKLLNTFFRRFPLATKAIEFEPQGVRFWSSSANKKAEQVFLYSIFSVAGDFEISATFQWTPVVVPKDGYGVSCGIAVETDSFFVELGRGNFPEQGSAFTVTKRSGVGNNKTYDDQFFVTDVKQGKLVLRREKNELICLTSDGTGELQDLCPKFLFNSGTVRRVLMFADPGGASTNMDARLSQIHLRAEEITTSRPKSEASSSIGWWLAAAGLVIVVLGILVWRTLRSRARSAAE